MRSTRTPTTRVAAYGIIVQQGKLLLCRLAAVEAQRGKWTLPGGGIEFGEHPESAAVRELLEETGFVVELDRVLTVDSELFNFQEIPMHAIRIIYLARIVGGELRNEVDGTTDACAWVPLDECPTLPLVSLAKLGVQLAQNLS